MGLTKVNPIFVMVTITQSVIRNVYRTYRTKCVDKNRCNPCKHWGDSGLIFFKTTLRVDKTC